MVEQAWEGSKSHEVTCFTWKKNSFLLGKCQRSFAGHRRFSFCFLARQLRGCLLLFSQRLREESVYLSTLRVRLPIQESAAAKWKSQRQEMRKSKGCSFSFNLVLRKPLGISICCLLTVSTFWFSHCAARLHSSLLDPPSASLPASLCSQRFPPPCLSSSLLLASSAQQRPKSCAWDVPSTEEHSQKEGFFRDLSSNTFIFWELFLFVLK